MKNVVLFTSPKDRSRDNWDRRRTPLVVWSNDVQGAIKVTERNAAKARHAFQRDLWAQAAAILHDLAAGKHGMNWQGSLPMLKAEGVPERPMFWAADAIVQAVNQRVERHDKRDNAD